MSSELCIKIVSTFIIFHSETAPFIGISDQNKSKFSRKHHARIYGWSAKIKYKCIQGYLKVPNHFCNFFLPRGRHLKLWKCNKNHLIFVSTANAGSLCYFQYYNYDIDFRFVTSIFISRGKLFEVLFSSNPPPPPRGDGAGVNSKISIGNCHHVIHR